MLYQLRYIPTPWVAAVDGDRVDNGQELIVVIIGMVVLLLLLLPNPTATTTTPTIFCL